MAWVAAGAEDRLSVGEIAYFPYGRFEIALCRLADGYFAVSDSCTHMQASLSEGSLTDGQIKCPRHGGRFDLRTGRATRMPAVRAVATFPVKVEAGQVWVELPD